MLSRNHIALLTVLCSKLFMEMDRAKSRIFGQVKLLGARTSVASSVIIENQAIPVTSVTEDKAILKTLYPLLTTIY